MKLSALIMLFAFLQVSAKTLAQKVTLSVKNAPIATVFEQISDQAGYDFVYSTSDVKSAKPVTINVKNIELAEVLKQIFNDQPLDYSVGDKSVIVSVKQSVPVIKQPQTNVSAGKIDVHGTVTDEKDLPLSGATVQLKNGKLVTTTNTKGEFILKGVDENAVIVFSYVGYSKREVAAIADLGEISLKPAENALDAVKIIAYGETTQRLNVGDVSTITAKTIEQQPVTSVLEALQDRVPGLLISHQSGIPGGSMSVSIRGQQSIANDNSPFYVIDGVPYTGQDLNTGYIIGGSDPLSFINPADIESVSVLKDADATSIYGSRAANGAILITTKKGKPGKTRLDATYRQGVEYAPQDVKWMNTQQYLQMRRTAFANDSIAPNTTNAPDLFTYSQTRYTNWENFFIGNAAQYKDIQTNISGGNANTQFLIGGGYKMQSTVFPFTESVPQSDVHLSINNTSLDNRFKVAVTASYSVNSSHLPQADLSQFANLPPNLPSLYNKNGSLDLVSSDFANFIGPNPNPLAFSLQQFNASTDNLVSNAVLSYEFVKNLKLTASFGYDKSQSNDIAITPIASLDPTIPETGTAVFNTSNTSSWIIEPNLGYTITGNWGKIAALLGATFEEDTYSSQSFRGLNYASDALLNDIQAAPALSAAGISEGEYKYSAFYSRLNYNYDDKYLFDLGWRRDGSSRFGPDNMIHDFASIGAAWIFSKEKVIQDNLAWLSFGKLRASYGSTGNDKIGDYRYDNLYQLAGFSTALYQGAIGLVPTRLPNERLEWEETRKLEGGLELGFLKDRVLLTASYYRDRSSNQLLNEPLPSITGFPSVTANLPAVVQNTGWEFTLQTVNVQADGFSWKTNINFTAARNKLLSFPGLAATTYAGSETIGQPLGTAPIYRYLDVNPQTGLYEFMGANGLPTSNPNYQTDRIALTPNTAPKFYGGIGNDISYKGITLSFFFDFRKQTGTNPIFLTTSQPGAEYGFNMPVFDLQAWQKPGDIAPVEKYTTGLGNPQAIIAYNAAKQSTYLFTDASYIRLSNLQLAYQFKDDWVNRLKIRTLKVFLQGQNLLTVSGYKGADPETASLYGLPPLRVLTAGLSVSL